MDDGYVGEESLSSDDIVVLDTRFLSLGLGFSGYVIARIEFRPPEKMRASRRNIPALHEKARCTCDECAGGPAALFSRT